LILGIGFGIYRVYKKEYGKALCEVAIGGVSVFPVYGTTFSIAGSIALGISDVMDVQDSN
jgi:hypothetical protein